MEKIEATGGINPGKREISRDKYLGTDCFLQKNKKTICKVLIILIVQLLVTIVGESGNV